MRFLFPPVVRPLVVAALALVWSTALAVAPAQAFFFCFSFGGDSNGPRWGGGRPPMGWQAPRFAPGPMAPGMAPGMAPAPFAGYPPPPTAYAWGAGAYAWPGYAGTGPLPNQTPMPGAVPWYGYAAPR